MAGRRGGFHANQSLSRRPRRKTAWGVGPDTIADVFSSTSTQTWDTGIALANEEQATIVRIHGFVQLFLTASDAAASGFAVAMGFGIVTAEAFAAGVASMPSPLTDANWDGWMWHKFVQVRSIAAAAADFNGLASVQNIDIDVKAMRILQSDNTLFGATEVVETGTATLQVNADTRLLLLLP